MTQIKQLIHSILISKMKMKTKSMKSMNVFCNLIKSITDIQIEENSKEIYTKIFLKLGNEHEYYKFQPAFDSEINTKNVFDRIKIIQQFFSLHQNFSHNKIEFTTDKIQKELEFISSHFYEIEDEKIEQLSDAQIECIIGSECLTVESEDSLLKFLNKLYEKRKTASDLFEYVEYCNVSEENLMQFIEIFSIEDLNQRIWQSICKRLVKKVAKESNSKHKYHSEQGKSKKDEEEIKDKIMSFDRNPNQEFNGIMKYLTDKSGGNICDNGTIDITSNCKLYNSKYPKYLVDFNSDKNSYFDTDEQISSKTITFDFKTMKVQVSEYSMQSVNQAPNTDYHMKNWFLEVSNDGTNWKQIDHRSNCSVLNGKLLTASFKVENNEFSRYVRYRHEGKNWGNGNYLAFKCIEFYGKLQQQQ